jgi:CheY-like chemotaxis protein
LPRAEQSPQPPKREDEDEVCNGSETILLAEDSDPLREIAREYLESVGYTILEAVSGKDALQRAKDFDGTIHLLLTDVVMPEMSGPELANQLTLRRPGIKVIFTSGYTPDTLTTPSLVREYSIPRSRLSRSHIAPRPWPEKFAKCCATRPPPSHHWNRGRRELQTVRQRNLVLNGERFDLARNARSSKISLPEITA